MRRLGGADERAGDAVHVEPSEWQLVHADMQHGVHSVRNEDMLPRHAHRRCEVQRPLHGLRPHQRPDRHLLGSPGPPRGLHGHLQHRLLGRNRDCRPNFLSHVCPNLAAYGDTFYGQAVLRALALADCSLRTPYSIADGGAVVVDAGESGALKVASVNSCALESGG
jgi:hypothetical protein